MSTSSKVVLVPYNGTRLHAVPVGETEDGQYKYRCLAGHNAGKKDTQTLILPISPDRLETV